MTKPLLATSNIYPIDPEPEDNTFYAPLVHFLVTMMEAGFFEEDRPEDKVARKIVEHGFDSLDDDEIDISNERLVPLARTFFGSSRDVFDAEFALRREPGYYAKPTKDERQGNLFDLGEPS